MLLRMMVFLSAPHIWPWLGSSCCQSCGDLHLPDCFRSITSGGSFGNPENVIYSLAFQGTAICSVRRTFPNSCNLLIIGNAWSDSSLCIPFPGLDQPGTVFVSTSVSSSGHVSVIVKGMIDFSFLRGPPQGHACPKNLTSRSLKLC